MKFWDFVYFCWMLCIMGFFFLTGCYWSSGDTKKVFWFKFLKPIIALCVETYKANFLVWYFVAQDFQGSRFVKPGVCYWWSQGKGYRESRKATIWFRIWLSDLYKINASIPCYWWILAGEINLSSPTLCFNLFSFLYGWTVLSIF